MRKSPTLGTLSAVFLFAAMFTALGIVGEIERQEQEEMRGIRGIVIDAQGEPQSCSKCHQR